MDEIVFWVGFWFCIALVMLWLIDRYDKSDSK